MPFVQRNEQGLIIGRFANPQPGNAEEWVPGDDAELAFVSPQQRAVDEREWRNSQLAHFIWLRDRHRDQLEIGGDTTLTADHYSELLMYMQSLRDWPQDDIFPDSSARPVPPRFLETMRGDQ